jgi:hypothetical protein
LCPPGGKGIPGGGPSPDQTPEGMELLNAGVVENVIAFLQGRPRNRVV